MSEIPANEHVVVHGVGLIGGSVAAAVRRRRPDCRVTGIGRHTARLSVAQERGLLDDWSTSLESTAVAPNAVVVVCLPVGLIAEAVISAARSTDETVLITDAGSVKQSIQDSISREGTATYRFVGAHPIAGSEQRGFEHADPDLFQDRPCIITPSSAGSEQVSRCRLFWESLGARVSILDAEEHDQVLSRTSHLPHVMAVVAAVCLQTRDLPFTGTGFHDTTRVAAGDPVMWRQILRHNRQQVLAAVRCAEDHLSQLSAALAEGDDAAVEALLRRAADLRHRIT